MNHKRGKSRRNARRWNFRGGRRWLGNSAGRVPVRDTRKIEVVENQGAAK